MPTELSKSMPDQAGSIRPSPLVGPYRLMRSPRSCRLALAPGLQKADLYLAAAALQFRVRSCLVPKRNALRLWPCIRLALLFKWIHRMQLHHPAMIVSECKFYPGSGSGSTLGSAHQLEMVTQFF